MSTPITYPVIKNWYQSPPVISDHLKSIGKMISGINADQIESLSRWMKHNLAESFDFTNDHLIPIQTILEDGTKIIISRTVKDEFIRLTPFSQDLTYAFAHGYSSKLAQGEACEYSLQDIVDFHDSKSEVRIKDIVRPFIRNYPNYRIGIALDLNETRREGTLVFGVIERDGNTITHTETCTLEELESRCF